MRSIMKILKYLMVLLVLSLWGCKTSAINTQNIQKGMTSDEIISLLGKPELKRFGSDYEQWEYVRSVFSSVNRYKHVVLDFEDGKIVNLDSYFVDVPKSSAVEVALVDQGIKDINTYPDKVKHHMIRPMSGKDFDLLVEIIKSESFSKNKLNLIQVASMGCYFTSMQCRTLLSLFPFDDDRIKALSYMKERITDRNNSEIILDAFSFSSNKSKAAGILGYKGY